MFYVYALIASNEQLPFYIGKSFVGSKRLVEHISRAKNGDKGLVYCKIRKVLRSGLTFRQDILAILSSEKESLELEKFLIKSYGRRNNKTGILCNLTDGGEGISGTVYSEDSRKRMSEAKKGNKINVGRKRPDMIDRFSKQVSQYDLEGNYLATFRNAREASKASNVHFGIISTHCTEEISVKVSKTKFFWRFGDNKERLIIKNKTGHTKKIGQYDLYGNLIAVFSNAKEAANVIGGNESAIRQAATGLTRKIWRI